MKILLTGATGYIGGSVAKKLIEKDHQVHGLVRSKEKAKLLEKAGVKPILALEKAPSGSFFFAENGEEALGKIAGSVSKRLGFGGRTESWPADEAIAEYGDRARFSLASNSRVRAIHARRLLGWAPSGPTVLEAVENDL